MPCHRLNHELRHLSGQHLVEKADGEDLVRPDGTVAHLAIHHIVEAAGRLVPEQAGESFVGPVRQFAVMGAIGLLAESAGQVLHNAERVVPECLDFDRFANALRHYPIAHLGIHPGELHARFAGLEQAIAVHADAVARAAFVPGNDVRERVVELRADEFVVLSVGHKSAYRFEEPERGIHRVVLGSFTSIRKAVGQHAAIHAGGEGQQNASRGLGTSRGERQAWEGDHGVAPPIAEPRVAGDDGAFGASAHDELVGCLHQGLDEGVRGGADPLVRGGADPLVRAGRPRPAVEGAEHLPPTGDFRRPQFLGVAGVARFGRRHDGCARIASQIETQYQRIEKVLPIVEPALLLDDVLEVPIPVARAVNLAAGMRETELGKTRIRRARDEAGCGLDRRVERAVLMRGAVIIAESDQRPQLECASDLRGGLSYQVLNHRGVFPMNHEDGFFDLQPVDFVDVHGEGILAELFQMQVSLWVDRAGIPIAGKVGAPAIDHQRLLQLGEQKHAPHRRFGRSDQEAVVTARVESRDGGRREAPDPIGLEPLAAAGDVQIAADRLVKSAHGWERQSVI